jgi:chemotaxis protein MotB
MIAQEESAAVAGEGEGENYFVAMTDMMVGVLFIFILALVTFALDFRRTTDAQETALKVAQEVAIKLEALQEEVKSHMTYLSGTQRERAKLLGDIQSQLAVEGLAVQVDETSGVVRLTEESVRFASGSAALTDRNRDNLGKIARILERVLPGYMSCRVAERRSCDRADSAVLDTLFIEGHTDTTGKDNENWLLSTERAVNTYRELIAVAPSLRSMRNQRSQEVISVSGYSSTRPIDAHSTREAWEANRRIDLRFVMETDRRPNLERMLRVTEEMREQIERLREASEAAR